jgi:hypothetical protein
MKLFALFRKRKSGSDSIRDYSFYSGYYMAQWTEQQINLGKPATMRDFFIYHGVCPDCQGAAQWLLADGTTKTCNTCKGTGLCTTQ